MNCPYCSAEMSSGYIKSPREIFWDTSPKVKLLPAQNGLKLTEPDNWDVYYKQAFYCPACRKILIDL